MATTIATCRSSKPPIWSENLFVILRGIRLRVSLCHRFNKRGRAVPRRAIFPYRAEGNRFIDLRYVTGSKLVELPLSSEER